MLYFFCMQHNFSELKNCQISCTLIAPRALQFFPQPLQAAELYLFTSAQAARAFAHQNMRCISVGAATSQALRKAGAVVVHESFNNHASGLFKWLKARGKAGILYVRAREAACDFAALGLVQNEQIVYFNRELKPPLVAKISGETASQNRQKPQCKIAASQNRADEITASQNRRIAKSRIILLSAPSLAKSAYLIFIKRNLIFYKPQSNFTAQKSVKSWQVSKACAHAICIGKSSQKTASTLFCSSSISAQTSILGLIQSAKGS